MANILKVSAEGWINEARRALIEDGLAGVKIDRLAKSLGVTRGGFYYHFKNQQDLLDHLISDWETRNLFLPELDLPKTPEEAVAYLDGMVANLIVEERYSPDFEQAMREWARIDPQVNKVVERTDTRRIETLAKTFAALGCDEEEASIRARVLYFHQMGYYALGVHRNQSKEYRLLNAPIYMRILCGQHFLEAAGHIAQKWL